MSKTATAVTDWSGYRTKLREILKEPKRRIILKAASEFGEGGAMAAFESTSGKYHREFITLWELYDEREVFRECVEKLKEKAIEIRDTVGFSAIVTCTATAKHLLDHVHASIEAENDGITVHYLGYYPFLTPARRATLDFRDQKVLILTDVVDSGRLVQHLAKVIRQLGGQVIAALAVVIVNPTLIEQQRTGEPPMLDVGERKPIRVHNLTDYAIPVLSSEDFDQAKIIKIDPETGAPAERPTLPNGVPAFTVQEMYDQFERSKALEFGFFSMDAGRYTTAIRFHKLLEECGDVIWPKIRDLIPLPNDPGGAYWLVATFDWGDIAFKEFVERRLQELDRRIEVVFVPRRDSGEYFLFGPARNELAGKEITLLLASVQSANKLRDLAALLASYEARRINVVCLLNRMGLQTRNFIVRIEQLLSGKSKGKGLDKDWAPFDFHPIYHLSDFSSEDMLRIEDSSQTLLDYYAVRTQVPSFKRWINQIRKYFRPQPVTASEFHYGEPETLHPTKVPSPEDNVQIQVSTEDAKLSLLCGRAAARREYDGLIQELAVTHRMHTIYRLTAILLADVSYLRMKGLYGQVRHILIDRVEQLRVERFQAEMDGAVEHIESNIQLESYLIVSLALLSYLDAESDHLSSAERILTAGLSVAEWLDRPRNFVRHFGDDRFAWTASMLLHLSSGADQEATGNWSRTLIPVLRAFLREVQGLLDKPDPRPWVKAEKNRLLKAKTNLDLLLVEAGEHNFQQPAQVIRFLHSMLFNYAKRHSPIETAPVPALSAVRQVVDASDVDPLQQNRRISFESPEMQARGVQIKEVQAKIEEGIFVAGQLTAMSEAARRLFFFSYCSQDGVQRYSRPAKESGFAADVARLGDLLQEIRIDNTVSMGMLEELTALQSKISQDLWDPPSLLRTTLKRFLVPLENYLLEAMKHAVKAFAKKKYAKVWDPLIQHYSAGNPSNHVLVEPQLLREVLKNLALNVRHSFIKGGAEPRIDLNLKVKPGNDADVPDLVELVLHSQGQEMKRDNLLLQIQTGTLGLQCRELEKYAGSLEFHCPKANEGGGVQAVLRLVVRKQSG